MKKQCNFQKKKFAGDSGLKKERLVLLSFCGLDFAFVKHRSEGFAAAFKKPNCKFGSSATLVFPSSHLPSLLGFADFLLALRTFSHDNHISQC